MLLGQAHIGEDISSASASRTASYGQLGADPVGDLPPLGLGGVGVVLGEGGGDERRDHAPAAPAGMGERVAQDVHPAALPATIRAFA